MELLPYHKYLDKIVHKHHQQIIQKITPINTDSKLHIKIITDCTREFTLMQFSFAEQICHGKCINFYMQNA